MSIGVHDLIERTARQALDPVTVRTVDAQIVHDDDGGEAYSITINLPPGTPLAGGKRYRNTLVKVGDALLEAGDRRFPRVTLHHEGEEMAEQPTPPTSTMR